ncbi:hypothetical protein [Thermorudis peleae]|uniref:hypothetical protein n=1 Tax=Thermorudis peleae TaxID=1382356 RepID=UPI000571F3C9|nr:hypothetical protein [Thermorudis peleae]
MPRKWWLWQIPYIGAVLMAIGLRLSGHASWGAAAAMIGALFVYGVVERRRARHALLHEQSCEH